MAEQKAKKESIFKRLQNARLLRGKMDFSILLMISVLCAFGLVMVFSASYYYAQHYSGANHDSFYYLKRQILYLAMGYPVMLLVSLIDYRIIEKLRSLFMAISIVLLIAVLLWGRDLNGGKRWLVIAGISIQPSELAKFGLMIFMCSYMSRHRNEMSSFRYGMIPMLIAIGVIAGLVMLQPNMSMAVIIGFIGVVLLYLGGCDIKQLLILGAIAVVGFFVLASMADYRMDRLRSFGNPESDPQGTGYQLLQSYYAIGSGGLFGKGLNNSYQKLLYMTYGESDFIFAILCEEFGFIGGLVVIGMYAWIVFRGLVVSMRCRNRFGSLLAAGISIVFGFQVFVNIGVVTGLLPTTGQALPFISAGGTSLLVFLAAMGLLLSISRDTNPYG
ncbi:MAG: putative lipid II flippase FtsW [Clostridia bacterium]|jgi:cell division protein FtsW|nr:putative lipid II flippase FtsW [Clostridia bacterium]MBR2644677.1 putative lipid II flippase FtsW [Clostridia bacterium]MBR3038629.1 putative lipid II flippase FtsW [Clostridia bacterium]MBR3129957.1 putative lipid II flippase FtsW [Clostridia bacterium]